MKTIDTHLSSSLAAGMREKILQVWGFTEQVINLN
jgi:hypothetical protein